MPRTCRHQAKLSTRRGGLRRLRRVSAAAAAPADFQLGGGFGADGPDQAEDAQVKYPLIGTRRSSGPVQYDTWHQVRSQVAAYLPKKSTTSESSEESDGVDEENVSLQVELHRMSKIKAAALSASSMEELQDVKAAMKTNAQWRKAAPWIRRCPTLPERRWEEERKPEVDWVALAGLRHVKPEQKPEPPEQQVKPKKPRGAFAQPPPVPPPPRELRTQGRDPSAELLLPSVAAERALHRETSRAQNLVALPQLTRLRRLQAKCLDFAHH